MNIPNDTRLKYDSGSYQEELARSILPGIYQLNSPYNDCNDCGVIIPDDPFLRYQNYGQNKGALHLRIRHADVGQVVGARFKANQILARSQEIDGIQEQRAIAQHVIKRIGREISISRHNDPCFLACDYFFRGRCFGILGLLATQSLEQRLA